MQSYGKTNKKNIFGIENWSLFAHKKAEYKKNLSLNDKTSFWDVRISLPG